MKKFNLIITISFIFSVKNIFSQKNFNFDFINCPRSYRFTIFDRKFIDQSMRFEPYTGNASGYTNPLA